MQKRQVRLSPAGVHARVNESKGQLVNISLTGALVRVDEMMEIGRKVSVVFSRDALTFRLNAGVVRTEQRPGVPGYQVGVRFLDPAGAWKKMIPQIVTSPAGPPPLYRTEKLQVPGDPHP